MCLTINEIKEDITEYESRIHLARMSMEYLPEGRLSAKERRLQQKNRAEIAHCEQLIKYAREGIEIRLEEV